jgi:TPR repeat protein
MRKLKHSKGSKMNIIKIFVILIAYLTPHYIYAAEPLKDGLDAYNKGNYKKAFKILKPLAKNATPSVQSFIASMYKEGKGTSKNPQLAIKWWRIAAEKGHIESMNKLGALYYNGEDIKQNIPESIMWLNKAAEKGDPLAKYLLDGMKYDGMMPDGTKIK